MNKNGFEFNKIDDNYVVVKYEGDDSNVIVPDEIDGVEVVGIDDSCFSKNLKITQITIPSSIKFIGNTAFFGCKKLKKITLNEGLISIGKKAFCYNILEDIILPNSLQSVAGDVFGGCCNLKKVTVLNKDTKFEKDVFLNCDNLKIIDLPAWKCLSLPKLVEIISYKFENKIELTKEEVTFIKRKSTLKKALFLSNNPSMVAFLIEQKVKINLFEINLYLENSIQQENTQINAMFINYKNTNFSSDEINQYHESKDLVEVGFELPTFEQFKEKWKVSKSAKGVTIMGYIGDCDDEIIPKNLACGTKIVELKLSKEYDFKRIKKLDIQAELTLIPKELFKDSTNIEYVNLPNSITKIGKNAFENCVNLTTINLPDNLSVICEGAFFACKLLQNLTFPKTLNSIENYAFKFCESLTHVTLPDSLTSISTGVFSHCTSLKEVVLPRNFTTIDDQVFFECVMLEKLTNTENITSIGTYAFDKCVKLYVEYNFLIVNGILCSYRLKCDDIESDIDILDGVKVIGKGVFAFLNSSKITIPDSVTIIEEKAFEYCKNLNDIDIPKSVELIKSLAFKNCSKLTSVNLPENVILESNAFRSCPFKPKVKSLSKPK